MSSPCDMSMSLEGFAAQNEGETMLLVTGVTAQEGIPGAEAAT